MAETIAKLRELSESELIRLHDERAAHTQVGTAHYLAELSRRDQQQANDEMLRHTRSMTRMTIVITIATIISTILVGITLFR